MLDDVVDDLVSLRDEVTEIRGETEVAALRAELKTLERQFATALEAQIRLTERVIELETKLRRATGY
jgi:sulfur carrier protein ThiS